MHNLRNVEGLRSFHSDYYINNLSFLFDVRSSFILNLLKTRFAKNVECLADRMFINGYYKTMPK